MAKTPLTKEAPEPAVIVENYRAAADSRPQDLQAQTDLGWGLYGAGKYPEAVEQFSRALAQDPNFMDALYGLGLAHKATGNKEPAVQAFNQVSALTSQMEDSIRGTMLRRLAHGHVSEMNGGDWNLEAEIWHREP